MEPEEEEIYEDGSSVDQSPISNLKNRFEQTGGPKNVVPALKPKPQPPVRNFSKIGGGGYLQGVVGNDKIPKLPVNGSVETNHETRTGGNSNSVQNKETAKQVLNNVLGKRESLVKIPDVFQVNADSSQNTPPKITPKPKPPVKKTFDSNNNSKPDAKQTDNSIPVSKEPDKTEDKKMTGGVIKTECSDTSSQGSHIAEIQKKLFTGNLPMKPENLSGFRNKLKSETDEKPNSPAGSGSPKSNIPKPKSQTLDFAVELRRKMVDSSDPKKFLHRVSVKSVIRNFDAKKFKLAPRDSEKDSGKAPEKPPKLDIEIDWDDLITTFKNIAQEKEDSAKHSMGIEELEEEEFYDDCGNFVPTDRVSFIEPMTEEEELGDEQQWRKAGFGGLNETEEFPRPPTEILVDGFPQEDYDDVATAMADDEKRDSGELYEPLPDEDEPPPPVGPKPGEAHELPPPPPPPEPPRTHKDSKESEKERKKKEKEEKERKLKEEREEKERKIKEEKEERERKKKQEKEQKKKEAELKNMEKTFKISMSELTKTVGQGKIKSTVTKTSKTLAVQEGQKVEIIRMGKPNPDGKFLVRLVESQADHVYGTPIDPYELMGYVESSNIEVDTGIIRRLMEGKGKDSSTTSTTQNSASGQENEDSQEVYEDVEGEEEEGLIEDDIYDECT